LTLGRRKEDEKEWARNYERINETRRRIGI
jgi:hypothetical protein